MGIFLWTNGLMGLIKNRTKNMGTWVDGYLNFLAVFFQHDQALHIALVFQTPPNNLVRGCFEPLKTLDLEVFGSLNTYSQGIWKTRVDLWPPYTVTCPCNSRETNVLLWSSPKTKKLRHHQHVCRVSLALIFHAMTVISCKYTTCKKVTLKSWTHTCY